MKFSVNSSELLQHLQTVAKVINSKSVSQVPILGNVLFELEGEFLTLSAADIAMRISTKLMINNQGENGNFSIPVEILLDSIRELADQPIVLEVNEGTHAASLFYQNGHYDFMASTGENFPEFLSLSEERSEFTISAQRLYDGLNGSSYATGSNENEPVMTCVRMDFHPDHLVFVASDKRIMVKYLDESIQTGLKTGVNLPPVVSKLLTRSLLQKESGDLNVSFDGKNVIISGETFVLASSLIYGNYPNYSAVIPASSEYHVVVDKLELQAAIKRVSIFSNKASKLVLLNIKGDKIHISAKDLDFSKAAEESISCQNVNGADGLQIAFDAERLQVVLQGLNSESITLELNDQTRAAVIKPNESKEGVEICSLIVPLKLLGE